MPVFKDFGENGELLSECSEPLNKNNLERYIKENGVEKARGYLDALDDIQERMKSFLEIHSEKTWRYNTNQRIGTRTIEMYEEQELFIEHLSAYLKHISPE